MNVNIFHVQKDAFSSFQCKGLGIWQKFILDKTTLLKLESKILNTMLQQVIHFLHYTTYIIKERI